MIRNIILLLLGLGLSMLNALTLNEAKELALKNNSRYLAQTSAYESARWSKQQALGNLLPSLTLSGNYVYLDPATTVQTGMGSITFNHDSRSAALTLTQPLFMGGKLWQAYKISDISAEISRLALENMRLSVISETESKYYGVLQLQDLLQIAEKDLQSSSQNLAITQVRYDTGTLSLADLLKVKAKTAAKEVALIQSKTALMLAEQDFASYLGLKDTFKLQSVITDNDKRDAGQLADCGESRCRKFETEALSRAAGGNLSLKTAETSVQLSRKVYHIARGSFLPTVALSASRSFRENGLDRYEFKQSDTYALSASIPLLPFWNNYSGSRKAYADMQKSTLDYQTAADGIMLGVRASVLNLFSTARQVKAADTALQMTRQTYEQLQERFRNNMLSATDMLDAEVMLMAAETSYTNAFYSYLKAKTALMLATGMDKDEIISNLNR